MREKKFTPGPWGFDINNLRYAVNAEHKHIAMVNLFNGPHAKISVGGEECLSNAHLIAAAPELLEALEALRECISETRGKDAYDAVNRADEVIAKAYGEQDG